MMASHYAPRTAMRLDANDVRANEALLAFGAQMPANAGQAVKILNLSPRGDVIEAAANLYAQLRALDLVNASAIAVAPIPQEGLGEAIRDRLQRAAAPRPLRGNL
jgi:L-threonylcarbamoyladenylate synthase